MLTPYVVQHNNKGHLFHFPEFGNGYPVQFIVVKFSVHFLTDLALSANIDNKTSFVKYGQKGLCILNLLAGLLSKKR